MIKTTGSDVDGGLSSVGTDLGAMGPDVGYFGEFWLAVLLLLVVTNTYQ